MSFFVCPKHIVIADCTETPISIPRCLLRGVRGLQMAAKITIPQTTVVSGHIQRKTI